MHISPLIMAVRILDATYPKDQNPENWRTISGAKVHLDGNGDIVLTRGTMAGNVGVLILEV